MSHALAYVTAARSGVSESELEDLISLDDKVLDDIYQVRLHPYVQISRDDRMQLLTKKLTPISYFSTIYRQCAEFPLYFGPGSEVICQGICQTQRPTVSVSSIGTTGALQRASIFGDLFFEIFISESHVAIFHFIPNPLTDNSKMLLVTAISRRTPTPTISTP